MSPDGATLAFHSLRPGKESFDVYVKQIGSDVNVPFADSPYGELVGRWSPDGNWLLIYRFKDGGEQEILRRSSIGGPEELILITNGPSTELEVRAMLGLPTGWSPDGNWILFQDKASPNEPYSLYAISLATDERVRLTEPPPTAMGDSGPVVSPDGRRLAFHRVFGSGRSEIYVLRITPDFQPVGEPKMIESGNPHNFTPTWAPDSKHVIFSSAPESRYFPRLVRINVEEGGRPERLHVGAISAWFPSLSTDGSKLTYSKLEVVGDIWRVRLREDETLDGTPGRFITSTRFDLHPSWSSDGERVAYISGRSGSREVWVCRKDGSGQTRLTSFGTAHTSAPAWSPDGARIAFASDIEGGFDIWLMSSTGAKPHRVTTEPADESGPAWSPDGRWLYFTSNRDGATNVWKMPAEGGPPLQVTSGGGGNVRVSPDGSYLYYAKRATGVTPVWRTPTSGGEEVEVLSPDYAATDFTVTNDYLYFIPAADPVGRRILMRMNLSTRNVKHIAELRAGSSTPVCNCERWIGHGLVVSPDARTILLGQIDYINSDVMLVENFQ